MAKTQQEKSLLGIAGVYFVAGELSKRNQIALVTSRNTKTYDIITFDPESKKSVPVQVKSTKQNRQKNPEKDGYNVLTCRPEQLDEKVKTIGTTFVFVYFPKGENRSPRYFIVPPMDLQQLIKDSWKEYVATSKHRKQVSQIEMEEQPIGPTIKQLERFENRWELLQ